MSKERGAVCGKVKPRETVEVETSEGVIRITFLEYRRGGIGLRVEAPLSAHILMPQNVVQRVEQEQVPGRTLAARLKAS